MTDNTDIRKTAQELKQDFLNKAGPLVQQYIDAALGNGELQSTNAGAREAVWELMSKLMLQSSDKLELDIQTADDVIKAVTDGKCTMEEGKALLSLYKTAKEIDTVGHLPGGQHGGLTINILSAGSRGEVIEYEEANQLTHEGGER